MSNALGDFLRARRTDARLQADAPRTGGRRRTTGLRREEVATAAGISADYYTRLEQGRETHPSDAVLDALARALQLDPDAADHLRRLRDAHPATARAESPAAPAVDEGLTARMALLVDAVRPNPAYVLDRLSTVVAANPEGLALHEGLADLPPAQRNTCRSLLLDPRARETFVEWEELARGAVAHLRAANVDDLQDPQLVALVAELSSASPLFRTWWSGHLVQRRRGDITHVRGADGTVSARRYEVLHLPEDGVRMTLWLPAL
ncbi:helix-turn-helix transcriptional regulator [Microbacterium azadirachtae]|uniref:Helix-turn-helix domain-containing protein n=1 Tax=Microbacterium azadirachtae TaxID=582680 RepID=A0A1I6I407_9MICO|nr:helix-turn-helix transcriptional regulator [Microbacterium azadirachtae]SFR61442.1 Helix-turn-helix domain-containing protein [Microbacterium azadirachtae]